MVSDCSYQTIKGAWGLNFVKETREIQNSVFVCMSSSFLKLKKRKKYEITVEDRQHPQAILVVQTAKNKCVLFTSHSALF